MGLRFKVYALGFRVQEIEMGLKDSLDVVGLRFIAGKKGLERIGVML